MKKYIENIENLSSKLVSDDQKKIIIESLKELKKTNNKLLIDNIYKLLMRRVKTGFVFDESPSVSDNEISILVESTKFETINKEAKNENSLIIGENYNALKNLLITHRNNIDIIYIDPPYNTEASASQTNDSINKGTSKKFIYNDKFSRTGWLNFMNDRLQLAKELLSTGGVLLISIDDNEQAYLKVLLDEIFGEDKFITNFVWRKRPNNPTPNRISNIIEYIISYGSNYNINLIGDKIKGEWKPFIKSGFDFNPGQNYGVKLENGKLIAIPFNELTLDRIKEEKILVPDIRIHTGEEVLGRDWRKWSWGIDKFRNESESLIRIHNNKLQVYRAEKDGTLPTNLIYDVAFTSTGTNDMKEQFGAKIFDYPKPMKLIKHLLSIFSKKDSIILDFFAGSGTTAHAVMELNREDGGNRKFILNTLGEDESTTIDIAKEITYERLKRIMTGKSSDESKFKWIEENEPYLNEKLNVYEIQDINVDIDNEINENTKNNFSNAINKLAKNEIIDPKNEDIFYKLNTLFNKEK